MHIALISPRKKRKNLKTHANSIESLIISNMFLKTHAYSMLLEKITLKPMRIAANGAKGEIAPGVFLAVQATSVEEHLSHAHSQLRTHARTHDTNTKRKRNRFPDWVS